MDFTRKFKVVDPILNGLTVRGLEHVVKAEGQGKVVGEVSCVLGEFLDLKGCSSEAVESSLEVGGPLHEFITKGFVEVYYTNPATGEDIKAEDFEKGLLSYKKPGGQTAQQAVEQVEEPQKAVDIEKVEKQAKTGNKAPKNGVSIELVERSAVNVPGNLTLIDFLKLNGIDFKKLNTVYFMSQGIELVVDKKLDYEHFTSLKYQDKLDFLKTCSNFDLLVEIIKKETAAVLKKKASMRLSEI